MEQTGTKSQCKHCAVNEQQLSQIFRTTEQELFSRSELVNSISPGLFEGGSAWGWGGGGGRKVPAAYNSKTINDNEMKFGGLVKDH